MSERRFVERSNSDSNTWEVYDLGHELGGELQPVAVCATPYVAEQVALALEAWTDSVCQFTAADAASVAERPLTDQERRSLRKAVANSSIPEAFAEVVYAVVSE